MAFRLSHLSNTETPIVFTPAGIVMRSKAEQPEKAPFPMLVTLPGIEMSVRL